MGAAGQIADLREHGLQAIQHNFMTSKLESLVNWSRARSLWPASSGWPAAPSR